MSIEELSEADANDVTSLWTAVGLARPWNDPVLDFRRALSGATSSVLGLRDDGELIGTVMVGHDGHRGWVYYLAVRADHQRRGLGRELMTAAEEWLRVAGAVKIQLMVRRENTSALGFYEQLGFDESDVVVRSRWLDATP